MFTPKELQEKTFDKAVFGGYDMQMVDEFLEPLTQDYITLYKENSVLKSKMKILVEKLEEYRSQELSMKKALMAAQQTSESIIAAAQKKAAAILNDAEATAQGKASSLEQDYAAEQQRVERARATAQAFIAAIEQEMTFEPAELPQRVNGGGLAETREIAAKFGVDDIKLVKPGIGEATRVLLRRVPRLILLRDKESPLTKHLVELAAEKNVEMREYPLRNYHACGIIKVMSDV